MDKQDRFGWQVRQWLNRSAMDVSPSVQNRLELARKQALARQRKANRQALIQQSLRSGELLVRKASLFEGWFSGVGAAVPALAVALGLFFLSDAQLNGEAKRLADIDAMVLGDELPISAYLDDGFSAFLRQADISPQEQNSPQEPAAAEPLAPARDPQDKDLKKI